MCTREYLFTWKKICANVCIQVTCTKQGQWYLLTPLPGHCGRDSQPEKPRLLEHTSKPTDFMCTLYF